MDNIDGMSYEDLISLKLKVDRRVREFRPIRMTIKYKRCGKDGCFCMAGPSNGSWGNLHGPYVLISYIDETSQKRRTVSLGRHFCEDDRQEVEEKKLDFLHYYSVPAGEREKMSDRKKESFSWCLHVNELNFEEVYGRERGEDEMDKETEHYATQQKHNAFNAERASLDLQKTAVRDELCVRYGIGCSVGQAVLRKLLDGNYYLKD